MTQRLIAGLVALPLTLGLLAVVFLHPLLFATYSPGPTFNTLGDNDGSPIINVQGHKTYPDTGDLRFVTVSVSSPTPAGKPDGERLLGLIAAWFNPTQAIYPYYDVYPKGQTPQDSQDEGTVDMVTSQDVATAVVLKNLGIPVTKALQVDVTERGTPAYGKLMSRDVFEKVDGKPVTNAHQLVSAIKDSTGPVDFLVERDGKPVDVSITPEVVDGVRKVGVIPGRGYTFPFQVSFNIDPNIGGPSAGTMFALALYDTLTPGSLTGGDSIAGTGTMSPNGTVGAIGGIQQKIAGSRRDGAGLFLVPAPNCADSIGAHSGNMRLVKVTTFTDALSSIKAWVADHNATLPTCAGS